MNPANAPNKIALDEELGRSVFSNRTAKRAQRSAVPKNVFLERADVLRISVDRLSMAPLDEAIKIARDVALNRNKIFYGWAVITANRASENSREVLATPIAKNPYHADISLPLAVAEDREERHRHAQELADASDWRNV